MSTRDTQSFRDFPNPYDFANPVRAKERFTGRKKQLDEIRYYLDQARRSPMAMNLALMGTRAAGKTSMLNMIEIEARERGFCVARVDLNESDAESPMAFFFKLFDCVFNAACEMPDVSDANHKAFGGTGGRTFETYLDMISSFEVPVDRTWCPFLFPVQYAKAAANGSSARISEHIFKQDLARLQKEVSRPVAILVDECNVLTANRILLEMIRNLFMNLPGYMLVFAGTYDLFPVMDEVFSPIVRQFKKIDIDAFESRKETVDCVRKPLEDIGLDPDDLIDQESLDELNQIHSLTAGRPYEIQLLCHCMFRRLQRGEAKSMTLSLDVLDDVLAELRSGQDIYSRPIIARVRALSEPKLRALRRLIEIDGHATFDQLWFLHYVVGSVASDERDALLTALAEFIEAGVIEVRDRRIFFAGDDFDRIYCKYFATHAHDIFLGLSRVPLELYMALRLEMRLHGCKESTVPLFYTGDREAETRDVERIVDGFQAREAGVFEIANPLVAQIYWQMFNRNASAGDIMTFGRVTVRGPEIFVTHPLLFLGESHVACLRSCAETVEEMNARATALNGSLTVSFVDAPIWSQADLLAAAAASSVEPLRLDVSHRHVEALVEAYPQGDLDAARMHANAALEFGGGDEVWSMNNLAYFLLAEGDYAEARELLELALDSGDEPRALPKYNLAVACARLGDYAQAEALASEAAVSARKMPERDRKLLCLWVASDTDQGLQWIEAREPDLAEAAENLVRVLAGRST
jgi:tetratricopeptide (TPR) repeat protein